MLFSASRSAPCALVVLVLVSAAMAEPEPSAPAEAAPARERLPVPSAAEVSAPEQQVRELFKVEYLSRKPEERRALGIKLLEQAKQTQDATSRYVLLRESWDVSADAGDAATAMEAIDLASAEFVVDALDLRLVALTKAIRKATGEEDRQAVTDGASAALEEILATERYDLLPRLTPAVESPLLRAANAPAQAVTLRARMAMARQVSLEYAKVRAARQVLERDLSDPKANGVLGRYLCLTKGDWATGLAFMVQGDDPALKQLAEMEGGKPAEAADRKKLGDGWWDWSQSAPPIWKTAGRSRAGQWYALAVPQLTGLDQALAQKRLEEINAESTPDQVGRAVDLIRLIDPATDAVRGRWAIEKGTLRCDDQHFVPRVQIPYQPPLEYDLRADWTQPAIRNGVGVVFVLGKRQGVAMWQRDQVSLLGVKDKQGMAVRADAQPLAPGKPSGMVVQVRKASVRVLINGQPVLEHKTDGSDLPPSSWHELKDKTVVGVFCDDPTVFSRVQVTEITGRGKATR